MMTWHRSRNMLQRMLMTATLIIPLAGCLSLEQDASSGSTSSAIPAVQISGSIGDGPVTGATVTVYSNSGEVLGSMVSDNTATFRSTLKVKGNQYPLRLVVSDGIDLVTGAAPDFEMVSVMLNPSYKQVNINPFTTLIVLLAEKLPGGLDNNNVDAARHVVLEELGFGLDTNRVADPISTEITEENVAYLVKSSEELGEMVRRTRDLIAETGKSASGDSIMSTLAADLTDGVVDGLGGVGSNPTVAAVANVVSGQVLVEAMSNSLRVGGVIATSTIDLAIVSTRNNVGSTRLTDSVTLTAQMLEQARVAVTAAEVLDSGSAVTDIAAGISSLTPGDTPSIVKDVLPPGSTTALDNAVNMVASAGTDEMNTVNQVVASGGTNVPVPQPVVTVNTPPVITGTPATSVTANSAYQFQPVASDADGDALGYSIANKPSWASFNTGTGRLGGTPSDAQTGNYGGIVISVSDGTDSASLPAFSIQVDAAPVVTVNTPPVITGTPATSVTANSAYQFQPVASDADGDALGYSIANKPSWASFNTGTGRLGGTPSDAQTGNYGGIVISVSDGTDSASLPAFSIQVDAAPVVNNPPVIGGTPATSVTANSAYQFQPVASDADGDTLSYSIANKPSWASFNTGTGRLSGTPVASDAGSYNGIVISVTDGTDTAGLAPFSIVVSSQTSSMTLSWVAPAARSDGTSLSLSEIEGYRIYYGTTAGAYPNSVDVTDGTATTATVTNLPVGTYYVVMSTYDTAGVEGAKSAPVTKTVQ